MHKTVTPNIPENFVSDHIEEFVHCDQKVLHAPTECEYCDMHPEWQALRLAWGIAFTGYEPDVDKKELPDPAFHARGANCQVWSGNVPRPEPVLSNCPDVRSCLDYGCNGRCK